MTDTSLAPHCAKASELFVDGQSLRVLELDRPPELFADIADVANELNLPPTAHFVDCRRSITGAWAGALSLLDILVPVIDDVMPSLLERHHRELAGVSPRLRQRFSSREVPLTESGPVKERVRSYPVDRAFRLAHGLVDMILAWQRRPGAEPLDLVCWGADDAGAMTARFLHELARRGAPAADAGEMAPIRLTLVVAPGSRVPAAAGFRGPVTQGGTLHVASAGRSPDTATLQAEVEVLEARFDETMQELETDAPRLVSLLDHLGESQRADSWRVLLLAVLNHNGWYEDGLYFAQPLIERLDELVEIEPRFTRWHIVSGLFNTLAALGRAEEAHALVRDEALAKVEDSTDLISIYYTMAMLHVRFLPEKDLELGERYLERSMAMVAEADLVNAEKHYLKVFNLNGLAFIRHLQGEPPKAIELCEDGYQQLEEHLASSEYRLHRSVLLYNLAQVFASTGSLDKAYEHYTGAMAIDPYYSEYYNERAGVLLRMGRLDEAVADLKRAVELSPPYPEVWINFGQIYNCLAQHEQAVVAYTRALDLDPDRVLPWLGLAQAREAIGDSHAAVRAYRRALEIDSEQPLVWANLAALAYEDGHLEEAAEAIEEAIRGEPRAADLYLNRAVLRQDLGRVDGAVADLRRYLELTPDAEDAAEARERLRSLESIAAA